MAKISFKDINGVLFYRTGDKGYVSKSGQLHIVDRYKRAMMRPDGHTVHAMPIEEVLMSRDMVRACAVVGLKLRQGSGVIPTAFIVLNEFNGDFKNIVAELDLYSKQKLPDRDRAIAYVAIEKIPYTSNGKVNYSELERFYIDEVNAVITDFTFVKRNLTKYR